MLPNYDDHSFLRIGDVITAKVTHVKEDGKLDLDPAGKSIYPVWTRTTEKVMKTLIEEYAGVLPFSDKASPEVIENVRPDSAKTRLSAQSEDSIRNAG